MQRLTDLPGYKDLTKEEKKRLKEVHIGRKKGGYNWLGELSVSKKELERGKNG